MATDRAVAELNKSVQNYNRQIRQAKRLVSSLPKPDKEELSDMEACLSDYLAIVEAKYVDMVALGNNEFDDLMALTRSTHEEMKKAFKTSIDLVETARVGDEEFSSYSNEVNQAFPESRPNPHKASSTLNASSQSVGGSIAESNNSQSIQLLAEAIAHSLRLNRVGPLEVEVFSGDPLDFVGWEVAFKNLIESSAVAEGDRLHYLKKYVGGPAREAIKGYFLLSNTSAAYVKAMQALKGRFGSEFAIAESFRERLDSWPMIKSADSRGLQNYADFLGQCLTAMQQIEELSILNDSKQNVILALSLIHI